MTKKFEADKRVAFCPHCGNTSTHVCKFQLETSEFDFDEKGSFFPLFETCYFLAMCDTCRQPLLYLLQDNEQGPFDPDQSLFEGSALLWPIHEMLPEAVPESVRQCYTEAIYIKRRSAKSFAIHVRAALEALCDDRGAVKGSLSKRLKDLVFKDEMPGALAEMSEVIRLLGNISAHDYRSRLSWADADVIDEFFKAIIEYVYIGPAKIRDFQKRLTQFGKPVASDKSSAALAPDNKNPGTTERIN